MQRAFPLLASILIVSVNTGFAELPTQTRRAIENGNADLAAVRTSSKQVLLDRFDKKLELTRASTKLSDEERKLFEELQQTSTFNPRNF